MNLIPRHLATKIARTLKTSRVVNIVGPRQTGKTTLVRDILHAGRFLNLDDESLLSSLAVYPFGQLTAVAAEAAEAGLEGPGQAYRGAAFVVYLGDQMLSFGPGRLALPLSVFWSYPTA